jgi:hypothetical protein
MCHRILNLLVLAFSISCVACGQDTPTPGSAPQGTPNTKQGAKPATSPTGLNASQMKMTVVDCLQQIAANPKNKLVVRLNAVDSLGGLPALAATKDAPAVQTHVVSTLKTLLCQSLEAAPKQTNATDAEKKQAAAQAEAQASTCDCTANQGFFADDDTAKAQRPVFVLHVIEALGNLGPAAAPALDAVAMALQVDDPRVKSSIATAQQAILTAPAPTPAQTPSNPAPATGGAASAPQTVTVTVPQFSFALSIAPQAAAAKAPAAPTGQ